MTFLSKPAAGHAGGFCRSRAVRRAFRGASRIVLLGCSVVSIAFGTARAQGSEASPDFDGNLMYELMIAELASRRGQLDVAMGRYSSAAARSEDSRVADRATRLAMFARDWPAAERAARRWCELDAEGAEPRELLAQTLLQQGEPEAAAAEYVALVDRVPATRGTKAVAPADEAGVSASDAGVPADATGTTRATVLRGVFAVLQSSDPVHAGVVMDTLAGAYPDEIEVHLGTARLALAANERERALAAVDVALEIDADDNDARLIRAAILVSAERADEAFGELDAALEKAPEDVQLRFGYAQLLAESGRDEAAQTEFETLYETVSDDADILLTIGLLSLDAGRTVPARRYLETLLETGEYAAQAHFYLARIADRARTTEAAIAHYEAVEPGPLYADARIRAAELHAVAGDVEIGRARLRTLADELPDPVIQVRLIVADSRLLQEGGAMDEAVAVLGDGLRRFPDDPDLLYARALGAMSTEDWDVFEGDLERLIEIEPDNAHALNALGYHLVDIGLRLGEAERYLEKANALEPEDASILDSLGWLRYRQGELETAVTLLRRAHALNPDVEIAAHLGEVLWVQGEHDEARDVWQEALAEQPDNDTLKRAVRKFTN